MNRLNERAWQIRKLMREAESVTDEGIVAFAKLKTAMVEARQESALPVGAGQSAVLRLTQAEQQLVSAAGNLLRVHSELSEIARTTAGFDENIPTEILDFAGSNSLEARHSEDAH